MRQNGDNNAGKNSSYVYNMFYRDPNDYYSIVRYLMGHIFKNKRAAIEGRAEEEQNPNVTEEKSLEVLEVARNANPPASLTSCVSINP